MNNVWLLNAPTTLDRVREKSPLVHCVTNYVTVESCANVLLAIGASPIMADDVREVEEITSLCGALVLNLGTLNDRTVAAMFAAGKRARELGRPIVLDPTGAGASRLRTETAQRIVEELRPTVLRGNISEIKALMAKIGADESTEKGGTPVAACGVDANASDLTANENLRQTAETIRAFAEKTKTTVGVSGPIDIVTDGRRTCALGGGDPIMTRVTGCGCMLSAMTGAFVAATDDPWSAATAAFAVMSLCGSEAAARTRDRQEGPSAFLQRLIDGIYRLKSERITDADIRFL